MTAVPPTGQRRARPRRIDRYRPADCGGTRRPPHDTAAAVCAIVLAAGGLIRGHGPVRVDHLGEDAFAAEIDLAVASMGDRVHIGASTTLTIQPA